MYKIRPIKKSHMNVKSGNTLIKSHKPWDTNNENNFYLLIGEQSE